MSYESLHNALRTRFRTLVELAVPLPTIYDNGPAFGEDASPYAIPDPHTDTWARHSIQPSVATVVSTEGDDGSVAVNTFRTLGIMLVSLYGPLEEGDGGLLEIVDVISPAFSGATTLDFSTQVSAPSRGRRDGSWWRIDVPCPFTADETA